MTRGPSLRAVVEPSISVRTLTVFVIVFNSLLVCWLTVRPGGFAVVRLVDDIAQFLGPMLVAPFAFRRLIRLARGKRRAVPMSSAWAAASLGLAVLGFALGQVVWTYYEQVLHQSTPFPSLADAGYLSAYPFLLAGIMLLPASRLALASRGRAVLDGLMVMVVTVTLSWFFVLGPTLLTREESGFAKIVGTAYPLSDLVLIASLLLLMGRARGTSLQPVSRLLCLGLGVIITTDSLFDYQTLHHTYATGGLFDAGWPLGYMLIGLAAALLGRDPAQNTEVAEDREDRVRGKRTIVRLLTPYALVPAVLALIVAIARAQGGGTLKLGVFVGAAILVALLFARQILILVENVQLNRRLEVLAATDLLTGLPNHRALIGIAQRELERARRYERVCSFIMVDLDHFKAINDGLGHVGGDMALREFAEVIRRSLREIDVAGRWGGEEFLIILPETARDAAIEAAERIRSAVAAHSFQAGSGMHVTCSLGVATFPDDAHQMDTLVDAADRAMYVAKRLGRNQVRAASDLGIEALSQAVLTGDTREETALLGMVEALAAVVDLRDAYTGQHSQHVAELSRRLAVALGLDASTTHWVGLAAQLHDIGKVGVPDVVLQKPGALDDAEWQLIQRHPELGAEIVSRVPGLRILVPAIRAHHERWDGRGYPDGLAASAIPIAARIIAAADAYDAMTQDRPYGAAMSRREAVAEIRRCAGTQFDPQVVAILDAVIAGEHEGTLKEEREIVPRSA